METKSLKSSIIEKLNQELTPDFLCVTDESHKHANHFDGGTNKETHFHVQIISSKLNDLSLIEKHRRIYKILENEMKTKIHALSINASPFSTKESTK